MGDSEKEILNNTSIDDVTVEELTMKTAKTSKGRKKSEKVGFFASMKAWAFFLCPKIIDKQHNLEV